MNYMIDSFEKKFTRQVLIVTGLSGAGKNVVMRAFEDFGFYCVDNLPVPLISQFLQFAFHSQNDLLKIALGIDSREKKFFNDLMEDFKRIKKLEAEGMYQLRIIFLKSSDETLIRRFQETRRIHPLGHDKSVTDAIAEEKLLLSPLMEIADVILDTDNFNIHELRNWVRNSFLEKQLKQMHVNLISFGFKYGVPSDSNLVYDLRFLPNPYFVPLLKPLDGRDEKVQQYIFDYPVTTEYMQKLQDFLQYSLKKYYEEGRFFVNVSIGCTGGKHRSVAFVEQLSKQNWDGVRFVACHRDIGKE
ncbi:TPA: RNase adapter RapZ [Candidatus Dependentiae bacterium]|nr:MAG: hypothetical protein UR14_C0004G0060 [candidate division TM6 bacterium GW2011_GWE2_31_21]KKP52979.1 MAG: hypothetical protein UR43_C0008G0061 [candidate division TM6 bacterium GW2011_GWF2_33_332]HBS47784.1 RNase adapter RapZ [Candidatus Dependentiae bacterium]HBZ73240.1 RNase adapter RapZ [Candidatus Dependentiae bacterium]